MDLKDLKNTWNKMSAGTDLDEEQIRAMLRNRTTTLIERIDLNIKIGFVVLFLLIVLFGLDDFLLTPFITEQLGENMKVPNWLILLSVFSNMLLFFTFLFFVIKYYRVRKSCDVKCNLRETLLKIINTLTIYRRLFFLALITMLVAVGLGFVTGMYEGFLDGVQKKGIAISDVEPVRLILSIIIAVVILVIFVGALFLGLRWGFRKLYGNYIDKLQGTLKELEEIKE
ncbi:MAG: hypothetical protein JXR61_00890 [Prolixibacteraceae bacterium]|nr:hypothetical protein [Prolixibacteraceae bacterium]